MATKPKPWKPATEADLCLPCVARWEAEPDLEVHQERALYDGGPVADIVLKRESTGEVHALEAKRSLNLRVVAQAYRHHPHASSWWVIVPAWCVAGTSGELEEVRDVLTRLSVGVIAVAGPERQHVGVWLDARVPRGSVFADHDAVRATAERIAPAQAGSQAAGSAGGGRESDDATALALIRALVQEQGPTKLTLLVRQIEHPYLTDHDAAKQLRTLLTKRGVSGLRYRGGEVRLA